MRTLELATLTALSSLLIGCAATAPIQDAVQFAAKPAPSHLRHEARRHVIDNNRRSQDVAQSIDDAHVSKLAARNMTSSTADRMDCTSIPVGAERALCLDRQSTVDVRALRHATAPAYSIGQDALGDLTNVEDQKLAKRLQNICRGC